MQLKLELLAPARNIAIGTAAIDCGADAVYIAGPQFGARYAAANSIEDIRRLCDYAHIFGVRIYATLNTLLEKSELAAAESMIKEYCAAGVDALIVQDPQVLSLDLPPIEIHASTQAVVRSPERARELEAAGFKRLILERQLSLKQIQAIQDAVSCDLEFFVHGALCMSYSGCCYISEQLAGRSANRGCCAQPCRSKFDILDAEGRTIARDRHILSMKDYRLDDHIPQLAQAGICSFKIEGRLKNESYVKNIVRHYRQVLDDFIATHPGYSKSSFGRIVGGFSPDPDLTFNRGYTSCFIDGKRSEWNSGDSAKAMGEYVGVITGITGNKVKLDLEKHVSNGDGLSFVDENDVCGMRVEVANGPEITVQNASGLKPGMKCFRNLNLRFERALEKNMPRRLMDATVDYLSRNGRTRLEATFCDGTVHALEFEETAPAAENHERARALFNAQISKSCGRYLFALGKYDTDTVYSYSASAINAFRRELAGMKERAGAPRPASEPFRLKAPVSFPKDGRELSRSKYCVKYELGLCGSKGPLFLVNNGRRLRLEFDCKNCEMVVTL